MLSSIVDYGPRDRVTFTIWGYTYDKFPFSTLTINLSSSECLA